MNGNNGFDNRTTRKIISILSCLFVVYNATAYGEETVALVGGEILTMTGRVVKSGTVVIRGEIIADITEGVEPPPEARVIDIEGKVVMPGMIDAYTHLGLVEIGLVKATRDILEDVEASTPQMMVVDAINPQSELIPVARSTGVTTVLVAPGEGNVLSGQSALIDLFGESVDDMVINSPVAVHINLGESPKHPWGKEIKAPQTRMGIASILRNALVETQNYMRKWEAYEKGQKGDGKQSNWNEHGPPSRDLQKESLVPVIKGEIPLIVRAHRVDDIETAIRISDEFGIRLILNHATDGYKVAGELARRNIPVLLGPVTTQPSSMEKLGAIYENAAILSASGVKIALQTANDHNVRILPYHAGLAVTYGLPREEALKAVTVYPAEIFGVADRYGSLESGKVANIAVFDGDPFEPLTRLEHLFIRGHEVDLSNRQIELYQRYLQE
jgi:imidazolonepropionase-like amidohydrolase